MTRNMAKIDEKFNDFSIATITELRDQIKQEVSEEFKKREELESTVCMLQEHVKNYQKQVNVLKLSQGELEQYGRMLCIRTDGIPIAENETANDVSQNVKWIIEESSSEIPEKSTIARFRPFSIELEQP